MNKKTMLLSKSLASLLVFTLVAAGCTKKRDAALSDTDAPNTFAISDFGDVQDLNSTYSLQTEGGQVAIQKSEKAKAANENGRSAVATANVPARLQFMFDNMSVSGQGNQKFPITFAVDKDFVTVYKIVNSLDGLTALERQYALVREEVAISTKLSRTSKKEERQQLSAQLQKVAASINSQKSSNRGTFLIPILKYDVTAYGTLQRTKNELREETSNLTLMKTDWSQATHIQISARNDDSSSIDIDANDRDKLDRTFSTSRLSNAVMTAGELKETFQIPNALNANDIITTSMDNEGLFVSQIVRKSKLSDSQKNLLAVNRSSSTMRECPADIMAKAVAMNPEFKNDCVMVGRLNVPVTFVRVKIPVKDGARNQTSKIQLEDVGYSDSVGLVSIPLNVQPTQLETSDAVYDSTSLIRVYDIKDKEFFFRRTLEDAPLTTTFMVGEAGSLQNVRFEMRDETLIVRRADKIVTFQHGSNDQELEDIMSIPVTYLRRELKDARGNAYTYPKLAKTNKEQAEYILLNWANNKLPATQSPVAYYGSGSCLRSISDTVVQEVDNRFDKGVLSFSFQYTANLEQSTACLGIYQGANDYAFWNPTFQNNARLKERISFKVNDGTTDKSYVTSVPFKVQNALGYGVWTIGQITPDEHGLHGREGTQNDLPVVHDFRNGRKLVYTVTGVPKEANRRQLYIDAVADVVAKWNQAYHLAFKGTEFDRNGDYIEFNVNGENGVNVHLGDIDRNIIHLENKVNENNGVLGVSQVGVNVRSGIVVADSLIIFVGNLEQSVAGDRRSLKLTQEYKKKIEDMKQGAIAEMKKLEEESAKNAGSDAAAQTNASGPTLQKLMKQVKSNKIVKGSGAKTLRVNNAVREMILDARSKLTGEKFVYGVNDKYQKAFLDRVMRKAVTVQDVQMLDMDGLIAQEMLAGDQDKNKLSPETKFKLQRRAGLMNARNQMQSHFTNQIGCLMTVRENLGQAYVNDTFEQSLTRAFNSTLAHEMGHSQGLTHNFIASYDGVNFTDDGIKITPVKPASDSAEDKKIADAATLKAFNDAKANADRNYSSVMDYIPDSRIKWGGIGSYDVHALRASHTGLLEINPDAAASLPVVAGKYVHINSLKKMFADQTWTSFTPDKTKNLLRQFKYCTDKDVGYDPVCRRFDSGTTQSEIVDNIIQDYEEMYINAHYGWDRYDFGIMTELSVLGRTQQAMINMRQMLDEAFYKLAIEQNQAEGIGYAQAAVKAYLFFNQLIHTPDASTPFMSKERFVATRVKSINDEGKQVETIEIVEKRALQDIEIDKDRLDTIGIENDKIMAMQLLTMKGLPYYKYASKQMIFSFVDLEKYLLGTEPKDGLILGTFKSILLNDLKPMYSSESSPLQSISGFSTAITSDMRAYAGISAILSLEVSTLRDTDNFANLLKVASSIGTPPSDRVTLTQLGVLQTSQARKSYYALDSATMAQDIMNQAARLDILIRSEAINTAMLNLVSSELEFFAAQARGQKPDQTAAMAKITEAKTKLIATLTEQNKTGLIVSPEMVAANPGMNIEGIVGIIDQININSITNAIGVLVKKDGAQAALDSFAKQVNEATKDLPIFAAAEKAVIAAATANDLKVSETVSLKSVLTAALTEGNSMETKYGTIMNNVDFLSRLTAITNPEFSR